MAQKCPSRYPRGGCSTLAARIVVRSRMGKETPYAGDGDDVFASMKMKGKQSNWMSRIMQHHIKPAADKLGIPLKGWNPLRHSYTTLLRQSGNNPKVVQDVLRACVVLDHGECLRLGGIGREAGSAQ
jgi:hypothetical protein